MSQTLTPPTYQPPQDPRGANRGLILLACTGMLLTAAAGFFLGRYTGKDDTKATSAVVTTAAGTGTKSSTATTIPAGSTPELEAALALHAAGKLPEAKAAYEKILATDATNKYALFNLGQIAQTNKSYDEAVTKYNAALAVDAKYFPALYNVALAYESKSDLTNAVAMMRKAAEVKGQDAPTLFNLGRLLIAAGQAEEGNKYVTQAVALDPTLATPTTSAAAAAATTVAPTTTAGK